MYFTNWQIFVPLFLYFSDYCTPILFSFPEAPLMHFYFNPLPKTILPQLIKVKLN